MKEKSGSNVTAQMQKIRRGTKRVCMCVCVKFRQAVGRGIIGFTLPSWTPWRLAGVLLVVTLE